MILFQIFLVLCSILLLYFYARHFKGAFQRVFFVLLFCVGIFFSVFPESSNVLANWIGLTRGADLIFYVFIMFMLSVVIFLFQKVNRMEKTMTEMVKQDALRDAKKLK